MEITLLIGYILAILVGVTLGLIGSGGSILAVPILVYVMGVEPVPATAYSLVIVGTTALVGGVQKAILKQADLKTVVIFGIPSIVSVYITRAYLLPMIPESLFDIGSFTMTKDIALMVLFALVMMAASISMIRSKPMSDDVHGELRYNYPLILVEGIVVGILTGLVGAGGGFLIIPALVILAGMPMKLAVGTSLLIIAAKSLLGFLGDLRSDVNIDWTLMILFTIMAITGIIIGTLMSRRIEGKKLKSGFGWMVLIMGLYILIKELFM